WGKVTSRVDGAIHEERWWGRYSTSNPIRQVGNGRPVNRREVRWVLPERTILTRPGRDGQRQMRHTRQLVLPINTQPGRHSVEGSTIAQHQIGLGVQSDDLALVLGERSARSRRARGAAHEKAVEKQ